MSGSVQARRWTVLVPPLLLAAVLLLPLLALAPEDRRVDTAHYVLFVVAFVAVVAGVCAWAWWRYGGDGFRFDSVGLTTTSRRYGDRRLVWAELRELGWVIDDDGQGWGLACRLRSGGRYDAPGPHIAGWLAQPPGRRRPPEVAVLRAVAEQHGVAWRDYVPAEVMTATP